MIIMTLKEISENFKELQGTFKEHTANYTCMKKDTKTINKSQGEVNSIIFEMKNSRKLKAG